MSIPLFVGFIGEDGEDYDGLTREFFSAVYDEVSTVLFHGPPNNYYPKHNQGRLEKREYEILGKIISLALSSGCAGPRFLNSSVCNLLISTEKSDVKPTIEDLADFELQQKLKEILRLDDPFAAMVDLDERYNAVIPCVNSLRTIRPQDFVETICTYKVLDVNHKEIEQIRLGLQLNVLPIMSKFKEDALLELCFRKKLTASEIKEHFTIFYFSEPAIKVKEEDINNFISFLENIESQVGKDVDFLTDLYSKSQCQLIVKNIWLEDILQYITGSRYMTKQIVSDTITIKFRSIVDVDDEKIGEGFMINTCEMSILFPLTKKFL